MKPIIFMQDEFAPHDRLLLAVVQQAVRDADPSKKPFPMDGSPAKAQEIRQDAATFLEVITADLREAAALQNVDVRHAPVRGSVLR